MPAVADKNSAMADKGHDEKGKDGEGEVSGGEL